MRIVQQRLDHEVGAELLNERYQEPGRIHAPGLHRDQSYGNQDAGGGLKSQLGAGGQPEISSVNYLQVVVGESDSGECASGYTAIHTKRLLKSAQKNVGTTIP